MLIHQKNVRGPVIDEETRCIHYHGDLDRIAIKFQCCETYYPCYECHKEAGCGKPTVWAKEQFNEKAVLCGTCGHELTISAYLNSQSMCPECSAKFNPGCNLHRHLYFEV